MARSRERFSPFQPSVIFQSSDADGRVSGEDPVTSPAFNPISTRPQLPIILPRPGASVHMCGSGFRVPTNRRGGKKNKQKQKDLVRQEENLGQMKPSCSPCSQNKRNVCLMFLFIDRNSLHYVC